MRLPAQVFLLAARAKPCLAEIVVARVTKADGEFKSSAESNDANRSDIGFELQMADFIDRD